MNLNRILINESEKKRILGLHSEKKSLDVISEGFNPADQVYTLDYQQSVQATIDFGTVFPKTIAKGTKIYRTGSYDKLYFGNTGFVMYCDRDLFVYKDSIDDLRIGAGDVRNNSLRKILGDIYCNGKKIKGWDELMKDNPKKDSPTNPIKNPINEPKSGTRNEMPICVRNAGEFTFDEEGGYGYIWVKNAGGKGKDYLWFNNHKMGVLNNAVSSDSLEADYKYYCKCVEGKCKPKTYPKDAKDIPDECDDKRKCSLQIPGGKVDVNCKSKSPYNAFTDAGLNWKEESRKWIEAKCNGTTPCILGNAQTNINLRNAFCDGTWGSKKEQDVQNPSLNPACSSKCAAVPLQAGQVGPQVQGYFYGKDGCYEATGTGGFGSKAECEACKCGSQSTIGDGGQKPGDGGNKLPDFIPPTIVKEKNPFD